MRLGFEDGRIVRSGKTYRAPKGKIDLCRHGMHASLRAIDALSYKHGVGLVVCRVRVSGWVVHGNDKLVGRSRRVLWMAQADPTLREFARWCAREALHLWDAPKVVRDYLETGDESLRAAARAAEFDRYATKLDEMLLALPGTQEIVAA